ncbi:D-methionine transport system substrate-binding protein [Salinibacillus kushneri]|uniref:Lipoprotein n=1 Tax=Salinibacillus kushneri TaxID=237682 RepID=A0A1H9ZFL7_9BACI|nr:MetQ/NlpA family ABC transporter substrate-binding protein [Salinibacillus kushneri]SES80297.1 D-methionine transport system substrate-binding protein [Salinibacillus kushneri]
MKKVFVIFSAVLFVVIISGCGASEDTSTLSEDTLKVGVTAGPHEEIMEVVKEVAAEDGLEIQIEVISDYITPNTALAEGDLDVNSYQHKPFLDQMVEDRDLDLVEVAKTVNFPMGIYSEKISEISELKEGDKVGLPNDPTNGARALMLFEQAGLITLPEEVGANASVKDIEENKLGLEFVELEAAQIPKQLSELAAAAINTNYAMEAGYVPTEDAIVIEPKDSPWVNLIAVRSENQDDPVIDTLINAYHSDKVKQFIEEEFAGSVVASW